jgi:hypothetical protein
MVRRVVVPACSSALRLLAATAAVGALQGCTYPGEGGTPPPVTPDAIVVHDMSKPINDAFSFEAVIGKILATASLPNTPANREALVQSMLDSFDADSFTNPDSNLPMKVDKRPFERGLKPAELLNAKHVNGLIPIGLFNRMDLAPADWSDCGEHRIVFATKEGAPAKRFFLIFEAKLPNPQPNADPMLAMKGCKPVAQQWRAIGAATDPTTRAGLLRKLYFEGLTGFGPVVDHLNYGADLGQVRANIFVPGDPAQTKWQLREFRVLASGVGTLKFTPGPVASNPLAEFYKDGSGGSPAEQAERARFQQAFTATYADALRQFDRVAASSLSDKDFKIGLFNCLGAPIDPRFNEFQSDAQGAADIPAVQVGPAFKSTVAATWTSPIGGRTVTRDEMFHRAGAITCGGCHQFSADQRLGSTPAGAVTWPRPQQGPAGDFFFVHVSEFTENNDGHTHIISDTLKGSFIPHRIKVLNSILADESPAKHCGVTAMPPTVSAAADAFAAAASNRAAARDLARQVLTGRGDAAAPGPLTGSSLSPADRVKALSDQSHAADLRKAGAVTPFRRPH